MWIVSDVAPPPLVPSTEQDDRSTVEGVICVRNEASWLGAGDRGLRVKHLIVEAKGPQ